MDLYRWPWGIAVNIVFYRCYWFLAGVLLLPFLRAVIGLRSPGFDGLFNQLFYLNRK